MSKNGNVTAYSYDGMGRPTVTSIGISGSQTAQYAYDALNQLVWEKNTSTGKAWQYSYDNGGNILSRTAYDYDGSNTSNPETVNYSYTDSTWGDLLTAYDGQEITYDGNGNPLSYRGWTMSWQGGRQLATMTGSSKSLSFDYGESGLRLGKTCTVDDSSTVHTYTWNGSLLSSDICGNTALYFHYDTSGSPMGFTLVNSEGSTGYFYVKNLQGDILKVIDAAGTVHASYTYDAWGNILSSSGDLADVNPLRYRGYYYDSETGLYYLQSRYYDPEVGRFINADGYASTGQGIIGCNMFAYCLNNPVNYYDSDGSFAIALPLIALGKILFDACVSVLAVVVAWEIGVTIGEAINSFSQAVAAPRSEASEKVAATSSVIVDTRKGSAAIYTVYLLCAKGDPLHRIVYIGRVKTENMKARENYHKTQGRQLLQYYSNLTWEQCRGLEQYLMLYYHTIKKGDPLYNQIRGVSPQNKYGPQYYLGAKEYIQNQMENELLNLWM